MIASSGSKTLNVDRVRVLDRTHKAEQPVGEVENVAEGAVGAIPAQRIKRKRER